MYMYPDNLKGKPILWLWYLRDIGIIGIGAIISVIFISQANFYLTIRLQDTSIFDFIQYACAFFIFHQQFYIWSYTSPKTVNQSITNKRKNKFLRMWR